MQDYRFVRIVGQVLLLHGLKRAVERPVLGSTKPAAQQTQVAMAWVIELLVDMIA
jgi:hypothetical protein